MSRKQHVPWRAAGTSSEAQASADDVVRETGWVFNNVTGHEANLAEFISSGDHEVGAYIKAFALPTGIGASIVEIGSGIGRMTAAFTREYGRVVACDLDAAFLERCRETVAQFAFPSRLRTVHVADGHSLDLPDNSADVVFSYITLQHCADDDAIGLSREAVRVAKPGGKIALNYRTWVDADAAVVAGRQGGARRMEDARRRQAAVALALVDTRRLAGQPAEPGQGGRDDRWLAHRHAHRARSQALPVPRQGHDRRHVRGGQPEPLVARRDSRHATRLSGCRTCVVRADVRSPSPARTARR